MGDARPQIRYWIPEGDVTERGLRADLRSFARRGFGAVELVAVNFFDRPMVDEHRWGTPHYYEAVRVVLDEAARLGLAVDIANGPGWPISVPQIADADDPATLYELTYGVTELTAPAAAPLALPERRVVRDEGSPVLVGACAYRVVREWILDEASYVDLLPQVHDEVVDWEPDAPGAWALFAFWGQPACHKVLGRFFVIDHLSQEGASASVAWWEDELLPALGAEAAHLRSFFCDSLEYKVAMEWTRDFAEAFEKRHGYSILPFLPVVGEPGTYPKNDVPGYAFADGQLTRAVRRDYLETLSWMYAERHLRTLCEGAARLGKTVRYQVAYNKPFCEEDAAAAVHIAETESLGRPTMDNLRVMAGSTHIARMPYLSFEAAAEFGHGYGQTQEDLLWWLKRAALAGCGAQVLHGASYCGDGLADVAWPGWEAWNRLCSNNWNRTISERSFADMTAAVARINTLRRERTLVDLAFWRDASLNDGHGADGAHYVHDGGLLNARGYNYEFLSPWLLEHENAVVRDGRLDPEGAAYKALVVAEATGISTDALRRLAALAAEGLPVFVMRVEALEPKGRADLADLHVWEAARDQLLVTHGVWQVHDYEGLLAQLALHGIRPDASYDAPSVLSAHVRTGEGDVYLLYNGNRTGMDSATGKPDPTTTMPAILGTDACAPVELTVELSGEACPCLIELASGTRYALDATRIARGWRLQLPLEADQLVAVALAGDAELPRRSLAGLVGRTLGAPEVSAFELAPSDDPCDLFAGGHRPVADVDGLRAGYLAYRYEIALDGVPQEAYLRLPRWNDALELDVNGVPLPVVAGLGRCVDLRPALRAGTNELLIRVFTNFSNLLDKGAHQRYGLFGEPTYCEPA